VACEKREIWTFVVFRFFRFCLRMLKSWTNFTNLQFTPSTALVYIRSSITVARSLAGNGHIAFLPSEGRSAGTTPKWQELCHCIRLLLALYAFVLMTASWLVWWSGVTVFTAASLFSTSVCTVYTTTETLLFVANYVPIVLYKHQQKSNITTKVHRSATKSCYSNNGYE